MEEKYLIDTCAVIKYLSVTFPPEGISFMEMVVDSKSIISFVSAIELQSWNPANESDTIIYSKFVAGSKIIMIDADIIKQTISIRKKKKLKIPDAIIAATAIANELTLISDNDRDFKKIDGLKYFNPASVKY
jgi:predicted nucleic acid-binding protein